jgi:hypothetical protein
LRVAVGGHRGGSDETRKLILQSQILVFSRIFIQKKIESEKVVVDAKSF